MVPGVARHRVRPANVQEHYLLERDHWRYRRVHQKPLVDDSLGGGHQRVYLQGMAAYKVLS